MMAREEGRREVALGKKEGEIGMAEIRKNDGFSVAGDEGGFGRLRRMKRGEV